ncbi:hypothetical protein [Haliangium sp.]|uniref:hypothetical protein n=1 Tax=Haliangium sp. TaxID=2663208 RepID=UPI003D10D608
MKRYRVYAVFALIGLMTIAGVWWAQQRGGAAAQDTSTSAPATASASESGPAGRAALTPSGWALGSQRVYRMNYAVDVYYSMQGDSPESGTIGLSLGGTLSGTVIDERDGRHDVEFALDPEGLDVSKLPGSRPAAEFAAELSKPFWVTYESDGRVAEIALPEGTSREAGGLLREIVSHLQVAVRPQGEWTAVEAEPTGECRVSARRLEDGQISKRKLEFVRVVRDGALVGADDAIGVPVFTQSRATYGVDAGGRIMDADVRHVAVAAVEFAGAAMTHEVRATFAHVSSDRDPGRARPGAVATMTTRPLSDGPQEAPSSEAPEPLRSPRELIAALRQSAEAEAWAELHKAQGELTKVVTGDPARLAEILEQDKSQPVLSAVGAAGTDEAQAALVGLATDEEQPLQVRQEAIDAFHEVMLANDESMGALLALSEQEDVRENALLALGALANRMGANDPAGADAWVDELVSMYQQAASDAERLQVLDALGNSANAQALSAIELALSSPNPELQASAAKNLRLMPTPHADELLSALVLPEHSPAVRDSALFATGYRTFEPMSGALEGLLYADPDPGVRGTVLGVLLKFAQRDENAGALELVRWAAENDPDESIRNQAYEALSSSQG